MRRRLSIIFLVVVGLLLSPFAVRSLTLFRCFDGQSLREILGVNSVEFEQLLKDPNAFLFFRTCATTYWLVFGPLMLFLVLRAILPISHRIGKISLVPGLCATVLSCVAIIFSLVHWNGKKPILSVSIANVGTISFGEKVLYCDTATQSGCPMFDFFLISDDNPTELGFWAISFVKPDRASLHIPVWMPPWITGLPTLALYFASRRPLPGHCPCGYNLTGNISGICPECGNPTKNTHAVSTSDSSPA